MITDFAISYDMFTCTCVRAASRLAILGQPVESTNLERWRNDIAVITAPGLFSLTALESSENSSVRQTESYSSVGFSSSVKREEILVRHLVRPEMRLVNFSS